MIIKIWYVYKIEFEDGTFYFGYRGASSPKDDFLVKYFSSSKLVRSKISDGLTYTGQILAEFANQQDALFIEQETIFKNFSNPNILNRSCKFGVDGFGILSNEAKQKISTSLKVNWKDPLFRAQMIESQKKSWSAERKLKQSNRLKGKARPGHSESLKGRKLPQTHPFLTGIKTPEHKNNISRSLKGKPKSDTHKDKLKGPKPKCCRLSDRKIVSASSLSREPVNRCCRLSDRKEMSVANFKKYDTIHLKEDIDLTLP